MDIVLKNLNTLTDAVFNLNITYKSTFAYYYCNINTII